jgi:N-acyl-D-amino-acid deacylase
MVVDGSGGPRRPADVALRGDRIAAVGDLAEWRADEQLKVAGLLVAPGFIDMHTHSDLSLLLNPKAESKLRQGVTTEVIGQCGFSPAPAPAERRDAIRAHFGDWGRKVRWTWESFADYLDALRHRPTSVNVVPVVGHGICRLGAMGEDRRAPTASELEHMTSAVRAAMEEGAFGVSTGLVYAPGMFAESDELVAVAAAAASASGIYFTHIRGEADTLLKAIAEAVAIGRRAGAPVHISHLKADGSRNWGRTAEALGRIEEASGSGLDIGFDVYPYTAWNTSLAQMLPAWAREGGGEGLISRLRDPVLRLKLLAELAAAADADAGRWERRILASVATDGNRPLQGKTIAAIAAQRGASPEGAVIDLLIEERGNAGMVGFGMCEDDVRRVLCHPLAVIGSDSAACAPYGVLGEGHPHPRTYGTFARVLGRYVREEKVLRLEDAVAKMSSRPATRLGLADRGGIAPGMAADIVVFDPSTVSERAGYQDPHQYAVGVRYVVVNGVIELDGDRHQGRHPGRVLERPGSAGQSASPG